MVVTQYLGVIMILLAAVSYVVVSYIFLRFPTLLHKKKKSKFIARHISHRGGAGENLENTMTAFKHALSVGTDMLEIDCHMTSDGVVVVSHDNDLYRVTGQHCLVSEMRFSDLPPLRSNLRPDFYWDHMTVCQNGDCKIPSLEDVLKTFPNVPVNIDIKINNDELIQKVAKLIKEYKRESITVWGNGSQQVVTKCLAADGNIPVLFCARRVLVVLLSFYTGLLPFIPLKESYYEIVMPSILLKKGTFNREFSKRAKIAFQILDFLLMNKVLIRHLRRRGIQVYLWVLNDELEWRRAFYYGATGVMTDFPTRLRTFLDLPDIRALCLQNDLDS